MVQLEIRTSDAQWARQHGTPGRDERTVIKVDKVEPLTFAGRDMVRFDLGAKLPSDWPNRWGMVPASWVVAQ
ncbi:hypothetical protein AB0N38_14165 [Micromonospora aurantiaca]|uniref:hypothetical protein n=1 Tax=Micromonospora aurantiaca (nom. illeg.) TaxID=47850 RepID=UPI003435F9EE